MFYNVVDMESTFLNTKDIMDNLPQNRNEVQSFLLVNALRILTPEECINLGKTLIEKSSKNEFSMSSVSGSFSQNDMENFAAKCMILGNEGKNTKELLKDFCDNDR